MGESADAAAAATRLTTLRNKKREYTETSAS